METIRKILIEIENRKDLADLLKYSYGNIRGSDSYGTQLFSIRSTYEIYSPLKQHFLLKKLSSEDQQIILNAIREAIPPKPYDTDVMEIEFFLDDSIKTEDNQEQDTYNVETFEISEITKREIFDSLNLNKISWYGKFDELTFLKRLYNLSDKASSDDRYFIKGAEREIWQHTINNDDWDKDWVLQDERFNIINGSDETFTRFICEMIHPAVRPNSEEVKQIVQLFNDILDNDNWELFVVKQISKKPVYSARKKTIERENNILFKCIASSRYAPSSGDPNSCYLMKSNWDDFHFKTSFSLYYVDKNKKIREIGNLKIMKKGMEKDSWTELPKEFENLSDEFCSLGYDQNYYEELMQLPNVIRSKILIALRDCVNDQGIFQAFESEKAMNSSLLRDVTTRNVTESFHNILLGNAKLTPYHFAFSLTDNDNAQIDVSVIPELMPPTNIHVLIGRNGVGKTRILAGISDALTQNSDDINSIGIKGKINFIQEDEDSGRFANMVAVVFSIFDGFEPIAKEKIIGNIRYSYVGLKKKNNKITDFKSIDELDNEFKTSLKECLAGVRKKRWIEAISILNSDPCFEELELDQLANQPQDNIKIINNAYKILSSGHKIVLLTITKLVQLVDDRTLVLIDEPENHLHPPLLSSFVRALSNLLIQRNGVAIIATHSPVVLQEVPKSCVSLINRSGDIFSVERPSIETFGENVGTLTREVFSLEVDKSGFNKLISKEASKTRSYERVLRKFNGQVGSEGKAIARSLILSAQEEDDI